MAPWRTVSDWSYSGNVHVRWFEGGQLNAAANCVDRHLAQRAEQPALIWEPDDPAQPARRVTYRELHAEVCRLANGLRELGVRKGDRVTIYLPMIPEAVYSMLACARIGAVHSVVFGGFSPTSLSGRIQDCESEYVITADEGVRGGKPVALKSNVDEALKTCPGVKKVLVVKRTGALVGWHEGRDVRYEDLVPRQPTACAQMPGTLAPSARSPPTTWHLSGPSSSRTAAALPVAAMS
jgi:acetyl-CoA synthetase